ncbi:MAG: ABC transporter substrate-binding protein [Sumerlaeia bacterium]
MTLPFLTIRTLPAAALLAGALTVAACSGGGGDSASGTGTGTGTGDATATSQTAKATTKPATSPKPATTVAEDLGEGGDLKDYLTPVVLDQFNPDVPDAVKRGDTPEEPQRGGILRVRTPADYQHFNPMTSTGAPERIIQLMLFDRLVDQDVETLEYFPVLAQSWATADLLQMEGGEVQEGILTELGEEGTSDSAVVFVPGAKKYYFKKFDVAEAGEDSVTLKEPIFGQSEFTGEVTENEFTYEVNQATAEEFAANTIETTIGDLATWTDRVGGEPVARPFRKQETAFYFYLRDDVTWHDGETFNAEDLVFSYETLNNPAVNAQHLRAYFENISEHEQIDERTVRFRSNKPYFNQFAALTGILPILPEHLFNPDQFGGDDKAFADAFNEHPFMESPVGTGPYRLQEWRKNESVTLVRNPNYWASAAPEGTRPNWNPAQPYMDAIEFDFIPEKSASLKELQKNNIDADLDIEPDTWFLDETNTEDFKSRIVRAKRTGFLYTYIGWNLQRPIFQDKEVRRALAMLIPRDEIAKNIHNGLATPITGPFYANGPGYDKSVPQIPYDPQQAKRILRKAGWLDRDRDGVIEKEINGEMVPFRMSYSIHNARDYHQKIADIIKEAVQQAGIEVTIDKTEWAIFAEKVREKKFDAVRFAWGTTLDPDPYQIWHSSQIANKGDNFVSYRNPRVDELAEKLRETFDPPQRWEMAREMHRIIAEDQPYAFLFNFDETYFYDRDLRGVRLYPSMYPTDFTEWWWSDPARRTETVTGG